MFGGCDEVVFDYVLILLRCNFREFERYLGVIQENVHGVVLKLFLDMFLV